MTAELQLAALCMCVPCRPGECAVQSRCLWENKICFGTLDSRDSSEKKFCSPLLSETGKPRFPLVGGAVLNPLNFKQLRGFLPIPKAAS